MKEPILPVSRDWKKVKCCVRFFGNDTITIILQHRRSHKMFLKVSEHSAIKVDIRLGSKYVFEKPL